MIRELIVVEGKNDAHAVRRALGPVEIIWTDGYGLTKETLEYISQAAQRQGVIVFTDPDSVGEQIRKRISREVPNVKHVYLSQKSARHKGDIGVENASPEDIRDAFSRIQTPEECLSKDSAIDDSKITADDLWFYGLAGNFESRRLREGVGKILGIGDANAKQFLNRLNKFRITKNQLEQAIKEFNHGKRS